MYYILEWNTVAIRVKRRINFERKKRINFEKIVGNSNNNNKRDI